MFQLTRCANVALFQITRSYSVKCVMLLVHLIFPSVNRHIQWLSSLPSHCVHASPKIMQRTSLYFATLLCYYQRRSPTIRRCRLTSSTFLANRRNIAPNAHTPLVYQLQNARATANSQSSAATRTFVKLCGISW